MKDEFTQILYKTKDDKGVYRLIKPVFTYGTEIKIIPRIGEYVFHIGKIWEVSIVTHTIGFIEICLDKPKRKGGKN